MYESDCTYYSENEENMKYYKKYQALARRCMAIQKVCIILIIIIIANIHKFIKNTNFIINDDVAVCCNFDKFL